MLSSLFHRTAPCRRLQSRSIRHALRHFSQKQDLSIGNIPFTVITELKINDSHPPLNLLRNFKLGRLESNPTGHIYYHVPEGFPSVAAELRFRADADGQDYRMPNSQPWSLPLYRIVTTPALAPLKQLLIQDNIVTPAFMEHCERLFPEDFSTVAPGLVLYRLRQRFPVHICRNKTIIWIVGEEKVLDLHIGSAWLGHSWERQRNHKGIVTVEMVHRATQGYQLRVITQPKLRDPDSHRSINRGRLRNLRCFSATHEDYLPVLEELVGPRH